MVAPWHGHELECYAKRDFSLLPHVAEIVQHLFSKLTSMHGLVTLKADDQFVLSTSGLQPEGARQRIALRCRWLPWWTYCLSFACNPLYHPTRKLLQLFLALRVLFSRHLARFASALAIDHASRNRCWGGVQYCHGNGSREHRPRWQRPQQHHLDRRSHTAAADQSR